MLRPIYSAPLLCMNTERTLYRKMRGEGLGGASMDMEAESGARGKLCENSALLCV